MNVSTLGSVRCQNCGLCIVLIALCRPLWQGFIQFCSVGAVLKRLREKQARDELFIGALCDDEQPRKRNTGPRPGGSNAAGRTDYDDSTWARMLIDHAADLRNPRSLWARKFRRRFRLPFPIFLLLLKRTRAVSARPSFLCSWCTSVTERISLPSFLQWVEYDEETNPSGIKATDAAGRARCPTALKLLGVLRILGRGTDLDSINELSGISEPVMNHFFHRWCKWARDMLSAEYLKFPESDEELSKVMGAFSALGFPGALSGPRAFAVRGAGRGRASRRGNESPTGGGQATGRPLPSNPERSAGSIKDNQKPKEAIPHAPVLVCWGGCFRCSNSPEELPALSFARTSV